MDPMSLRRDAHGRARRRARRLLRHRAGHDALPRHDRRPAPPAVRHARARHGDRDRHLLRCRRSCSRSSRPTPSATARSTTRRCSADLGAIWAYLANPLVFGLVSVGVGSLLHSNGAAIGVSLGFSLGGAHPHRRSSPTTSARPSPTTCCRPPPTSWPSSTHYAAHLAGRRVRGRRRLARSRSSAPGSGACCATSTERAARGRAPARATPRAVTTRSPASPAAPAERSPRGCSVGGSMVMLGSDLVEPARHVPRLLAEHARAAPAPPSGA